MKKRNIFVIILTVIIALFTVVFSGCESYNDMKEIPCDGNYSFVTYRHITTNGKEFDIESRLNKATEWKLFKFNLHPSSHSMVSKGNGGYFGYVFHTGLKETRYDLAIGYMEYIGKYNTKVYTVIEDVEEYQSIYDYGDNSLIFNHKGQFKIFDCNTKTVSVLEIPAQLDGYKVICNNVFNGYAVITFKDEAANQSVFYVCDGKGFSQIYRTDGEAYPRSIKNGCLILGDRIYFSDRILTDVDILIGINLTNGERLNADEALKLYNDKSGKFYIDGKEYVYWVEGYKGEGMALVITGEDGENSFTIKSITESVPQVKETYTRYGKNSTYFSCFYNANNEFYITIDSEIGLIGYSGFAPPIVLRYDPDKSGFSYIGYHTDHAGRLYGVQKL